MAPGPYGRADGAGRLDALLSQLRGHSSNKPILQTQDQVCTAKKPVWRAALWKWLYMEGNNAHPWLTLHLDDQIALRISSAPSSLHDVSNQNVFLQ